MVRKNKRIEIRNLLYGMSENENLIYNQSLSPANPVWVFSEKNKTKKDKD